MSHDTMPVHIRKAKGVPVLASETTAPIVGLRAGWQVVTKGEAFNLARLCELIGKANRRSPMLPGQRIALQGLARQIRHRLAKKEGR